MDISAIDKPTVCIVRLHDETQNPAVLFQVTIDPSNVSPSEAYMRFGFTAGDEIMGWKPLNGLEIVEVLGWPNADGTVEKAPKPEAATVEAISA